MQVMQGMGQYVLQMLVSVGFAFLIGMEVYDKTDEVKRKFLFGTERTMALIALLGFILLRANTVVPHAFLGGLASVTLMLLVYYFHKTIKGDHFGITIIVIALLMYCMPLLMEIFPIWLSMLIVVLIMVIVEIKERVKAFTVKVPMDDFLTLAKFVFLSCVILPLVPDKQILASVPVSPYKLWLAIVAISAISYLSYLLRKYVFPNAGLILTGILGGLYSSTATTFILAKKSKEEAEPASHYASAILAATGLMFLRVYILIVIFNPPLAIHTLPWFIGLVVVSAVVSFVIYRMPAKAQVAAATTAPPAANPLELRVALVFGILYVGFSLLTQYTIQYFGHSGLNILSFVVGFTDIDHFLLNMFQGKYADLTLALMGAATIQAIVSNNVLKMIYALSLGSKDMRRYVLMGFLVIIACNIAVIFLV